MFKKIMVPVDLAHVDHLERALDLAAKLSKTWDAPVTYVGVTDTAPGEAAHNPEEFAGKLEDFARAEGRKHTLHGAGSLSLISHDPSIDLEKTLMKAVRETGADLVVIGSHKPGMKEHIFSSHGGYLASHSGVSVFVVR